MMAFLMNKILLFVVAVIAAVILGWWVYNHVYDTGYEAAVTIKNTEIAELKADAAEARAREVERQDAINNLAKQREAAAIAELDRQEAEIHELQRKLAGEAQQDPNAGKPVLGSPSVRRINQIR